jgi:hypothetical protein
MQTFERNRYEKSNNSVVEESFYSNYGLLNAYFYIEAPTLFYIFPPAAANIALL